MKKGIVLLLLLSLFASAFACLIEVKAENKKAYYNTGDELVVLVRVTREHRNCSLPMEGTTYEPDGLKILAATDWKETAPGVWERKMKLKVTGTSKGKLTLDVRRKCNKENSVGTLVLNSQ